MGLRHQRSPRIVPVTRCHALPGAGREMIEAHDTASAIAGALWVVEMVKEVDIVMLGDLTGTKYGESLQRGQSGHG